MTEENRWLTDQWWTTPHNFSDEVRQQFSLPDKIYIHDVTLRESMQSPRVYFTPEEKIRIAKALDKLGVYSIEIGMYMSEVEKEVTRKLIKMQRSGEIKPKVVPLIHWNETDVDAALECGAERVILSQSINPWAAKNLHNVSETELIERLSRIISYAKNAGLYITTQIYDTYRAPLEFLERATKTIVLEAGADSVAISDTRGCALPWTVTAMVRKIKSWIPGTPLEHHGHNPFGLATAVMLAAATGGAEVLHTSINNLGESVGNAATEEVAIACELFLGIKTGINLEQIYPVCNLVAELSKHPIARNKPITGENMFITGSGQVAWRNLKFSKTERPFENMAFLPEVIGKKGMIEAILGVGCGKTIIRDRLDSLGISATEQQLDEIVDKVKEEARLLKWSVSDIQFDEIVKEVLGK